MLSSQKNIYLFLSLTKSPPLVGLTLMGDKDKPYEVFMEKCLQCNDDTRYDEWANHDEKICISCGTGNNDICLPIKDIDEPKETNQQ